MNKIKEFMQEKSISQSEIARRTGYKPSHVSMVINGQRRITDGFRYRWQEAFGPAALRYLNGSDQDGAQ